MGELVKTLEVGGNESQNYRCKQLRGKWSGQKCKGGMEEEEKKGKETPRHVEGGKAQAAR